MNEIPKLISVNIFETFGFYDLYRAQKCILGASKKNLVTNTPLMVPFDTKFVIVGRFFHDAMSLLPQSSTVEELQLLLKELVSDYEDSLKSYTHLNKYGPFKYWEEVTDSKACAIEKFFLSTDKTNAGKQIPEYLVTNTPKNLVGRIDYLSVDKNIAKIIELKSSSIRDESGELKAEYAQQISYYSALAVDMFNVEEVIAELRSLNGDKVQTKISKKEAYLSLKKYEDTAKQINLRISDSSSPEEISQPSAENCLYCEKRTICASFKCHQTTLGIESPVYIVEGEILEVLGGSDNSPIRKLKVNDENLGRVAEILVPRNNTFKFIPGQSYLIENLTLMGKRFKLTPASRIYG